MDVKKLFLNVETEDLDKNVLNGTCILEPYLFLSNRQFATDYDMLRKYQIRRIVTVQEVKLPPDLQYEGIDYKFIQARDEPNFRLDFYFHRAHKWIQESIKKKERILIHCAMGVSRSASLVIAYFILRFGMSLPEAHLKVLSLRPCISPNIGFWSQLHRLSLFPLALIRKRKVYFLILEYFLSK